MSKTMLDKLAPEEFLRIFELSENPALIFASEYYHNLVNEHDFVKKRLIQLCCTNYQLRRAKANPAHYSLRLLLQEDWLSLGWLLEAQNEWLADRSEDFVRDWFSGKELLSAEEIENVVQSVRTIVENKDQQLDPDMLGKPVASQHFVPTIIPIIGNHSLPGLSVSIKISRSGSEGVDLAIRQQPQDADPDSWDGDHKASFCFGGLLGCLGALPARLLQGPWTQEQGDILGYFLQWLAPDAGGPKPYKTYSKHIADASAGLMRAIKTRNLAALSLLGGSLKVAFRKQSTRPIRFDLWEAPVMSRPFVPGRAQDSSSWICIRAPQCYGWQTTTLTDWVWTKAHLDELLLWLWEMNEENEPLVCSLAFHCSRSLCGWEYGTDSWDKSGERNFDRLGRFWTRNHL